MLRNVWAAASILLGLATFVLTSKLLFRLTDPAVSRRPDAIFWGALFMMGALSVAAGILSVVSMPKDKDDQQAPSPTEEKFDALTNGISALVRILDVSRSESRVLHLRSSVLLAKAAQFVLDAGEATSRLPTTHQHERDELVSAIRCVSATLTNANVAAAQAAAQKADKKYGSAPIVRIVQALNQAEHALGDSATLDQADQVLKQSFF